MSARAECHYTSVLKESELQLDSQKALRVGACRILLVRTQTEVFAVKDLCPHALLPLAGAAIESCSITCPRHGAKFDLRTGQPLNGVTAESIKVYATRIESGHIQIALGSDAIN